MKPNTLADALVFAVSYIDSAPEPTSAAAIRQAQEARVSGDREAAAALDTWMEDVCGEPWVGNRRES